MKWMKSIVNKLKGLSNSVTRYPLTVVFLIIAAVFVTMQISSNNDYSKWIAACAVGAVLSITFQAVYERFFEKLSIRILLMAIGLILSIGYYFIIEPASTFSMEIGIRTVIALFALLIAYIWVPAIRGKVNFNESFMAVFKALFQSAFYSGVIMGGCSAIIAAINTLIYPINSDAYSYVANIDFVLFAPIFFLSLIPLYPGRKSIETQKEAEIDEDVKKAIHCPKFLEVLLSYIIIPIISVFTLILLIYIVMNITGEFWTNNLLEPMLIAYAITVIVVYILVSGLENKFAALFKKIFPKVMLPIVLFQIISSILSLGDTGITHTRYFVILFGIFAVGAGVVMSFFNVRKNGIIALLLIIFAVISITPPTDAFTVSRLNQTARLQTVLEQNEMIINNSIIPNASISKEDKAVITQSVEYLSLMEYTNKIEWMPKDFKIYEDFTDTFGFSEYYSPDKPVDSVNVYLTAKAAIDIYGYDYLTHTYTNNNEQNASTVISTIKNAESTYDIVKESTDGRVDIVLKDENGKELLRFNTDEIFERYAGYTTEKSEMSLDDATFTAQSDIVNLKIIVQNASMNTSADQTDNYTDIYLLVQFIK